MHIMVYMHVAYLDRKEAVRERGETVAKDLLTTISSISFNLSSSVCAPFVCTNLIPRLVPAPISCNHCFYN